MARVKMLGCVVADMNSPQAVVYAHLLANSDPARVESLTLLNDAADIDAGRRAGLDRLEELMARPAERMDFGWRPISAKRPLVQRAVSAVRLRLAAERALARARRYAPDVIYSSQKHWDLGVANLLADRLGKPQIIHLHYPIGPWLRQVALERLLTCARVIAVSDFIRDDALRHGVPPERVTAVPNAMHPLPPVAPEQIAATRAELGIGADEFVYGIVARIDPAKNHAELIAAFEQVAAQAPESRLVIVGDGEIEQEMRARAASGPAAERILFTGRRGDVPRLLAAFDVFTHPTRMEAWGMASLEALAAGRPVIAYREGGVIEMVGDDGSAGLLTPPGDVDALAAAMLALRRDPERARAMGRAARERVARRFRPEVAGARFSEIVQDVARRSV